MSGGGRVTSGPEVLTERLEWRPVGTDVPLVIELEKFFADVVGGE